jgi:glycosyltransferase involved in cell wall biosynthesis
MKLAIVCGHFMPEAGYYEVHLAEALVKSGHQVRVFTSNRSNLKLEKEKLYPSGLNTESEENFEILRFKPWLRFGATILPKGLLMEIENYNPEIVLAIGIAKLFPNAVLLNSNKRDFLLYSFFGENNEYYAWHNFSAIIKNSIKFITRSILKRPFYNLAIKTSDRVFLYTPETYDFLCRLVSKNSANRLQSKCINTSLGFDSSIFYFDIRERTQLRQAQGISDSEFVILTATRYSTSKSLEFMVDKIIDFRKLGYPVKYWIIGFNNENSLDYFRDYVQSKDAAGFITCYPFMDYASLRKYQAAADVGMWCQVTISIQQSMGTGLPVLLEEKKSVSHLLNPGSTGLYFSKNNIIESLILASHSFKPNNPEAYVEMRKNIENTNHLNFSYRILIQQIVSS